MPSREERIALEVTAEDDASRTLEHVADAAEELERSDPEVTIGADDNASRIIDDVSDEAAELARRDHEIVLTARAADLRAALADTERDLERVKGKAREVESAVGDIGGPRGAGLAGNAVSDLTGPLGGASSAASDFAGVLDGASDTAQELLTRLGASEATVGKVAGAMGLAGFAVAGIAAGWSLIQERSKKAREEAEKMRAEAEALAELVRKGEVAEAAEKAADQYRDLADAADAVGIGMAEVLRFVLGQSDALPGLEHALAAVNETLASTNLHYQQNLERRDALESLRDQILAERDAYADANGTLAETNRLTGIAAGVIGDAAGAAADAADATDDLTAAYDRLHGAIDLEGALLDVQEGFDDVQTAAAEAYAAAASGSADAEGAARDHERAVLGLRDDVLAYAEAVGGIPAEKLTQIDAAIAAGDLARAEAELAHLTRAREAEIRLTAKFPSNPPPGWPRGAAWPPTSTATAVTNVTVHMPRGTRPADVVRVAENYARRNGGRPMVARR